MALPIGGVKQRNVGVENKRGTIRVALSKPTHIIHIESDITAEDLLAPSRGLERGNQTSHTIKPQPESKREVTLNGARFRGTISGDFVDLSDNADLDAPFITKTLDIFDLDEAEVGYLASGYKLTTTFAAPNPQSKIAFAALAGVGEPSQPFLMVDVDVPQEWILLQGVVMGQKFPQKGFGWAVRDRPYFKVPDVLKNVLKKDAGLHSSIPLRGSVPLFATKDLPHHGEAPQMATLQGEGKIYYQAQAQVAPPVSTPTPSPTATPIVVVPNPQGGSTISIEVNPSVNGIRFSRYVQV